ncbi:hypothetical protein ColTof3_04832 [Colletotrichum tofieldiae]|nr:hypothetical protein ColTof3_04832 [Colletotrichum tofieldiae]
MPSRDCTGPTALNPFSSAHLSRRISRLYVMPTGLFLFDEFSLTQSWSPLRPIRIARRIAFAPTSDRGSVANQRLFDSLRGHWG